MSHMFGMMHRPVYRSANNSYRTGGYYGRRGYYGPKGKSGNMYGTNSSQTKKSNPNFFCFEGRNRFAQLSTVGRSTITKRRWSSIGRIFLIFLSRFRYSDIVVSFFIFSRWNLHRNEDKYMFFMFSRFSKKKSYSLMVKLFFEVKKSDQKNKKVKILKIPNCWLLELPGRVSGAYFHQQPISTIFTLLCMITVFDISNKNIGVVRIKRSGIGMDQI